MKLNGAEITIKLLERQGIKEIAGIPGGSSLPLYDALYNSEINHILTRHEQGAAFIAQGMARSTGKAAVCFATSGPGATNLLTAIADAKLDSVPIIAITGQVPYHYIGTDSFQEVDTYGLTIPIVKHNFLVRSVEDLFRIIPEAFRLAECGRPGPIVIDIPKDIQLKEYEFENWPEPYKKEEYNEDIDKEQFKTIAKVINEAKKPVFYIGGGIIASESSEEIFNISKKNTIPVATTLMGLGAYPCEDPLYLGMLGMHGARFTNLLLNEADLIIAIGVRFDDRAVGNINKFCPDAKILHIDIDEAEINKVKSADYSIKGDTKFILNNLIQYINQDDREFWESEIRTFKAKYPFVKPSKEDVFHPINIIEYVSSIVPEDTIITTDVGQHQMWTAQVYPVQKPRTLLTSGGLGTMGFGLPAAIGAAVSNPDKTVICFSGDGSILMNIQELATLADLNLNIKILILNNGHLGMVRQQQELFYSERYVASKFTSNPDFATISRGFNIKGCNLSLENEPMEAIKNLLSEKGPCVLDIPVRHSENVLPIVPPGAGNTEMLGGEVNE
ncbi:MAG: biosynthetic-type acetolactate synthase large subunit [Clostridiaceae bacterium]